MKRRLAFPGIVLLATVSLAIVATLSGCGGGGGGASAVSGSVATIDRTALVNSTVWVDGSPQMTTNSLATGIYRISGVPSGWQTIRARATMPNGDVWVGSSAVEVLKNQPTMNANIVLVRSDQTTSINGKVTDDFGSAVGGARVLLTTRPVNAPGNTTAYDGPYGSMVTVTDGHGRYTLTDVPIGLSAQIAASKVGFKNSLTLVPDVTSGMVDQNFQLSPASSTPDMTPPELDALEAWTMPSNITRSQNDAMTAVKAFVSTRYRQALAHKKGSRVTRDTPAGSLIEIDLYWNGFVNGDSITNDPKYVGGYGVYRSSSATGESGVIDFVRDPYGNFYSDTDLSNTPDRSYSYWVTALSVAFLNDSNHADPGAQSDPSNTLRVVPLGQLVAAGPSQGATVGAGNLSFSWSALNRAVSYQVLVYDKFPTMPIDPSTPSDDPIRNVGVLPIWNTSVGGSARSVAYAGPALQSGKTYYWIIVAAAGVNDSDSWSYSELRHFTAR